MSQARLSLLTSFLFLAACQADIGGGSGDPSGQAGSGGSNASGGSGGSAGGDSGDRGGSGGTGQSSAGAGGSAAGGQAGGGSSSQGGSAGASMPGGEDPMGGAGGRDPDATPQPDAGPGAGGSGGSPSVDMGPAAEDLPKFSFFATSLEGMRRLAESDDGFGGDLRFGEANGLAGGDKICQTLAAAEGFGAKTWRAFLSVVEGPEGEPVHGIDRIGEGPWYDRNGRLVAMDKQGLLAGDRPAGDPQIINDLPDEKGQGLRRLGDSHDVITGSTRQGRLRSMNKADTCQDWTSANGRGTIGFGHAWPAGSGRSWVQVHTGRNCAAGVNLRQNGAGDGSSIGAGGGYGAIYCFALTP